MLSADWASESVWVSVGGLWVPVGVLALSSPAGYVFLCGFLPGVVLVELSCCLLHLHRGGGCAHFLKCCWALHALLSIKICRALSICRALTSLQQTAVAYVGVHHGFMHHLLGCSADGVLAVGSELALL